MMFFKSVAVRARTNGRTDRRTDGRCQTYYLPCFAVDNNGPPDPNEFQFLGPQIVDYRVQEGVSK